ncbi:hypothetical protein J6590_036207 [Homalodisca vitripennis]|nr:hypothetical protein J6590_036207 [Homalodisca vitripennis]
MMNTYWNIMWRSNPSYKTFQMGRIENVSRAASAETFLNLLPFSDSLDNSTRHLGDVGCNKTRFHRLYNDDEQYCRPNLCQLLGISIQVAFTELLLFRKVNGVKPLTQIIM